MPKRKLTAEDLYTLTPINGASISPDGQHIIFEQQEIERETEEKYNHLWLISCDGPYSARQFTFGPQRDHSPQWSPDGQTLAFLSNRSLDKEDKKETQIYLMPVDGGEARPLTNLQGDISQVRWSPNGQQLVCRFCPQSSEDLAREADPIKKKLGVMARHITRAKYREDALGFYSTERQHIWLIDAQRGLATQVTEGDYDDYGPCFSPDGSQILFLSNRSLDPDQMWDEVDIFIVDCDGQNLRKLAAPLGAKSDLSVSPDGQSVAYLDHGLRTERWQPTNLMLCPLTGQGEVRNLTASLDFGVAHDTLGDCSAATMMTPVWSADSQQLYVQVSQHGRTDIRRVNVTGEVIQPVVSGSSSINAFSLDQAQTKLVYLEARPTDPGQIWGHDLTTGQTQQLTQLNQALLNEVDLGQIEEIWFKGPDDNDLQGWILTPPDFNPAQTYPSILEIHGGPMAQYGYNFMHEFYFLAAQGYVVYFCNPRGGQGYGAAHAKAIYNDWGNRDYADLMAWVELVAQKPYIDPARMGVTGGSYGGYMTNWIITRSQRFKAAVTQRCVSNMVSMFGSSDLAFYWQALFGCPDRPWENIEHYWRLSPISEIGNVRTPTLVIHSEKDLRCDIEQGEQVYMALKSLGVPTEMVRFPDESHGLSRGGRTDRRIARLEHILRWFDTYLKA